MTLGGPKRFLWQNLEIVTERLLCLLLLQHFRFSLTVHLALVGEDDLPPATGRVDGEGLLEALLDVWGPHPLRVPAGDLLVVVKLWAVVLCYLLAELAGEAGQPDGVTAVHSVAHRLGRPRVGVVLHVALRPGHGGRRRGAVPASSPTWKTLCYLLLDIMLSWPARDVLSARGWGWPPHSKLDREILADVRDRPLNLSGDHSLAPADRLWIWNDETIIMVGCAVIASWWRGLSALWSNESGVENKKVWNGPAAAFNDDIIRIKIMYSKLP